MTVILRSKDFSVYHFGLTCGSWVVASRGSTLRTFLAPMGSPASKSAVLGNQMVARFILLALLIYAKKGCWTLEQPKSSLLFRHTRFQWLLRRLVVFRKSFWMKHWGAKTPKRTVMWSSSKNVRWFRTGKLKRGEGGSQAKALVTKYRNSRGETKFQGNKRMAKSSTYPLGFGLQYLSCFSSLQTEGNKLRKQYKVPRLPEHMQINAEFFRSLDWSDIWRDAKMEEVVQYLRTSKYCTVPSSVDQQIPWEMFQPQG